MYSPEHGIHLSAYLSFDHVPRCVLSDPDDPTPMIEFGGTSPVLSIFPCSETGEEPEMLREFAKRLSALADKLEEAREVMLVDRLL